MNEWKNICDYQELSINGIKHLFGVKKKDHIWKVILTNMTNFWKEELDKESILRRCKDLNPSILFNFDIDELMEDMFKSIFKCITFASTEIIKVEMNLEGGIFYFSINLQKCLSKDFFEDETECIFASFFELYRRYNLLKDFVIKKDREITEYKAQDVKLLNKSWETKPFSEELFEIKYDNKNIDSIKTFLQIKDFHKSINHLLVKPTEVKKELITVTEDTSKILPTSSNSEYNPLKRRNNNLRCAVSAKLEKKKKD